MNADKVVKLVLFGGDCSGKSALVLAFNGGTFTPVYDPTIEDSYLIRDTVDETNCIFDILDTAGQEQFSAMREQHMALGEVVIFVFDLTSRRSFDLVSRFYLQLRRIKGSRVLLVLVGSKGDMKLHRQVPQEDIDELAQILSCPYVESSAKEGVNVQQVFHTAARLILARDPSSKRTCAVM